MSYISLPYPVLPSVPSIIAEDINSSHKEHLKLHAIYGTEGRKTRQSSEVISARIIEEWRDPWVERWMEDQVKADGDERSAKDLEIGHREVARAIQAMKKVRKYTYNQHEFINAVATSGLARTILELTNRSAYYDKPHQASYARRFGFGLVLGDVLGHWTPDEWAQQAEESLKENPPAGYNKENTLHMQSGRDLIEAITSHPNLIPNVSNPAAIFFLCSSDNFQFAWRRWLSWGLDAAGYRVWDCNSEALYRRTMQYLQVQRLNQRQWDRAKREWNEIIFFIIERSMELRDLLKDVDKQTHQPNILHCTKCASEVPEKRCVQRIDVELNTDPDFVERWEGVGVTKVPPEECMKPRKGRKASKAAEIVDPDEIGLRKIAIRDEEVIQRCGKHIFLLFSKQKLQDFIWYNAFSHGPNGTFDRLVRYSQTPLGVQPVLRGGKFDFWVVGQMIPFGARQPSGGHLADHYTFYQGINADTLWGITVLFEQAEMSATILATARAVHPDLVKKIKNQSALCERVGLCGLNLFNCSGYTAPQHYDKDATPSLCAQFVLQAEKKWSESFDSTLLHGTMLPSENTILHLRGGANSVGTHTTTRERDRRRAERNERTINNYHLRQRAWAGHENEVV
ncbi:hypothetical protein HHX47_DHR6000259 [Lentinula edodes]|nr:hypothetical protein HHX47_DHR6000259 [Lentinula edodes]